MSTSQKAIISCLIFALSASIVFGVDVGDCPPIAFVKRAHFDRPFGIGSMIGWDVYKAGGGIFIYDPSRPGQEREIFRRDDGVVFDMSPSFDAKKLVFAWKKIVNSKT